MGYAKVEGDVSLKELLREVRGIIHEYAKENNYSLNPDFKVLAKLYMKLADNIDKHGFPYCPCRIVIPGVHNPDNVCPCPFSKDEIEKTGHCKCRLFYSERGLLPRPDDAKDNI